MAEVVSRRGSAHYVTDCLSCGERFGGDDRDGSANRAWARKHAGDNPGHVVHAEYTVIRRYATEASPC